MARQETVLSIIIVNYKNYDATIRCLESIKNSGVKFPFEIILVDNSRNFPKSKISEIKKNIIYVDSKKNIGFGAGNNLGSKKARGKYLFFLNSDTKVLKNSINNLIGFLEKNKNASVVAPLLLNKQNIAYQQGSKKLGFLEGIVCLSFLNSLFPNNKIAKGYFLSGWSKKDTKEVDVVPGTAFLIIKDLFESLKGFDEKFFLYFEEFDLCRRLRNLSKRLFILPSAKVIHYSEQSSSKANFNVMKHFKKSRFNYFKKHEGLIKALIVEFFARIDKFSVLFFFIILWALFLRIYKLNDQMIFIGDQGWFYLLARDILIKHSLPLVGIASSHPWLHQGSLWSYILAIGLWTSNFDPLGGGYLAVLIDALTVLSLYIFGQTFFNRKVGISASFLYATSPLAVFYSRMPYHTSPIPVLAVLFIFSLVKWINGNIKYLPIVFLSISLLYNFELFSAVLFFIPLLFIIYGTLNKKNWAAQSFRKGVIVWSLVLFLIPMLPMIIYDFSNGFNQTLKFGAWMGYKVLPFRPGVSHGLQTVSFLVESLRKLILPSSKIVSLLLIFAGAIFLMAYKLSNTTAAILLYFLLLIFAILFNGVSSQAYLFFIFPVVSIILAVFLDRIFKKESVLFLIVGIIGVINTIYLISDNYSLGVRQTTIQNRISTSKQILSIASGVSYNLKGEGPGSEFENFTANYKYLTWWFGNEPSKKPEKLIIVVKEDNAGINVKKIIQ